MVSGVPMLNARYSTLEALFWMLDARRRRIEDGRQESKGTGNQEDGRLTTEGREFRIGLENVIFLWAELHKWREKASSPFD